MDTLSRVLDPEVPVLNIVDMGIVRGVEVDADGKVHVSIVPTYTGCPAMQTIRDEIAKVLQESGQEDYIVHTIYHEVWTTDWMTKEALRRLEEYGIAPPSRTTDPSAEPNCPYCTSSDTKVTSLFGSTPCKSLHFCNACIQPFEHFKCH